MAVRDYAKLAEDIRDTLGAENIKSAAHCATRLRLILKESPSAETTKKIAAMPGVIQVQEVKGQYQIVIGMHAKDVYEELAGLLGQKAEEAEDGEKQSLINRIIATMSAVFAPFVYILAAAGLIQGALILICLFRPAFAETGTYEVFSFISWTPFTFLPVFIAVTASKHFKTNTFIALFCCLALVNPTWTEMAARISAGESITFFGIPLSETTYTSNVIAPLILVWVLSKFEKLLKKVIPDLMQAMLIPMICAAVLVPLTILVIGPISEVLAGGIASGFNALNTNLPVLAGALIGGFWEVIVIFGVHWGATPIILANFDSFGHDSMQAYITCAVIAQAAACFAVFFRSRKKEMRSLALSSGLTGIFGITEPAIYGVTLRLKKPFIAGCIGGAAGAVYLALTHTTYYVFAGLPGILTTVNAVQGSDYSGLVNMLIGAAITAAVTIVLVFVIGVGDEDTAGENSDASLKEQEEQEKRALPESITVCAPVSGKVIPLREVKDETFASGTLGQGAAIIPEEGMVRAPFDGTVTMVFETKHAIALTSTDGAEVLIHVGLDTVNLNGKYFDALVKDGQKVRKGDPLLRFDLGSIRKEYDPTTPVLVTNAEEYQSVTTAAAPGSIQAGSPLLAVHC